MTALVRTEAEQERSWRAYLERLKGLEGAEYDRVEQEAWEELQHALRDADGEPRLDDPPVG